MRSKKISSMSSWMREGKFITYNEDDDGLLFPSWLFSFFPSHSHIIFSFSSRPTMLLLSNLIFVSSSLNIFSNIFLELLQLQFAWRSISGGDQKRWGDGNKLNFFLVLFPSMTSVGSHQHHRHHLDLSVGTTTTVVVVVAFVDEEICVKVEFKFKFPAAAVWGRRRWKKMCTSWHSKLK